jgi:hypothetical protein
MSVQLYDWLLLSACCLLLGCHCWCSWVRYSLHSGMLLVPSWHFLPVLVAVHQSPVVFAFVVMCGCGVWVV